MEGVKIKRALRRLKKEELRLRYGSDAPRGGDLLWNVYFSFREGAAVRYPYSQLLQMGREEFRQVLAEFYAALCADFLRRSGQSGCYDPRLLLQMGLPPEAGETEVKSRFRALAKELHPDCGGDGEGFIRLMETYRKLLGGE